MHYEEMGGEKGECPFCSGQCDKPKGLLCACEEKKKVEKKGK